MTQKQIEYFIKAYELKNITAAAEQLFVSRSALSYAVSELESEFKATLFSRTTSGVEPTEAGVMLYETLIRTNNEFKRVAEKMQLLNARDEIRPLKIAVSRTNDYLTLPVIYDGFAAKHADINVAITEAAGQDIPQLLIDGAIDVAITPSNIRKYDKLAYINLFDTTSEVVVSQNSIYADKTSLTPQDVCNLSFAFLGEPPASMIRELEALHEQCGKKLRTIATLGDWTLIKHMIQNDYAASFIPRNVYEEWKGVVGIPIQGLEFNYTHKLVWNKSEDMSPQLAEFVRYIRELYHK